MDVKHINPFICSLVRTFETMVGCDARRGAISLEQTPFPGKSVSGVIGLTGKAVGTVVIDMSEQTAVKIASALLMMELTEMDDDVLDAVGEIANMVAGAAKAELEEMELSVSLPNIIVGECHQIRWPKQTHPISIPFDTDMGDVNLMVALETVDVPASV